jgi:hypothetical protein
MSALAATKGVRFVARHANIVRAKRAVKEKT